MAIPAAAVARIPEMIGAKSRSLLRERMEFEVGAIFMLSDRAGEYGWKLDTRSIVNGLLPFFAASLPRQLTASCVSLGFLENTRVTQPAWCCL